MILRIILVSITSVHYFIHRFCSLNFSVYSFSESHQLHPETTFLLFPISCHIHSSFVYLSCNLILVHSLWQTVVHIHPVHIHSWFCLLVLSHVLLDFPHSNCIQFVKHNQLSHPYKKWTEAHYYAQSFFAFFKIYFLFFLSFVCNLWRIISNIAKLVSDVFIFKSMLFIASYNQCNICYWSLSAQPIYSIISMQKYMYIHIRNWHKYHVKKIPLSINTLNNQDDIMLLCLPLCSVLNHLLSTSFVLSSVLFHHIWYRSYCIQQLWVPYSCKHSINQSYSPYHSFCKSTSVQ